MEGFAARRAVGPLSAFSFLVASAASLWPVSAAHADPQRIELNQALDEKFSTKPRADGERLKEYRIDLKKGDAVRIDLESSDFDPVLKLERLEGKDRRRLLAMDDDSGQNLNARLRVTAPENGSYIITAIDFGLMPAESGKRTEGRYRLVVVPDTEPPPRPVLALTVGSPVSGSLSDADADPDSEISAQTYEFQGEKGQRLVAIIDTQTATANTRSAFGSFAGLALEQVAGGPVPSSRLRSSRSRYQLVSTLPAQGSYRLTVNAAGLSGPLPYTLTTKLETVVPRQVGVLMVGAAVAGDFTFRDPEADDAAGEGRGYLVHAWRFSGRPDRPVRLELCAPAGAPTLRVIGATALGDRLIASSDGLKAASCGENTGARLDLKFVRPAEVRVLASPGRMVESPYSLKASFESEAAAATPAEPPP